MYKRCSVSQPLPNTPPPENELEISRDDVHLQLVLEEGTLQVYDGDRHVWTSDASWDVRKMLLADPNNDSQQELVFVLWKPFAPQPTLLYEDFGFQLPFDEGSLRNHLFLYGRRDGEWRALWCSSPVPDPILDIAVGDVNGDGANELAVLEGSYADGSDKPARHVTVWRWNGWGFTLEWRSAPGQYCGLMLTDITGDRVPEIVVKDRC